MVSVCHIPNQEWLLAVLIRDPRTPVHRTKCGGSTCSHVTTDCHKPITNTKGAMSYIYIATLLTFFIFVTMPRK